MAAMTQQEVILPAATVVNLMALILISFLTVPSVYSISRRFYLGQKYKAIRSVSNDYEDEDGVATEEARMAYSAIKSKYMALASTLVGLIVNIITNVYSEIQPVPSSHLVHWFTFGSWAFLLTQALHIVTIHDPIKRFDHGFLAGVAAAALCASIIAAEGLRLRKTAGLRQFNIFVVLDAIQLVAGLIAVLSCFSIPRRPALVLKDHAIDGQYTVSVLGRYTFSLENIPNLHLRARSMYLESHVRGLRQNKDNLLKTLLLAHAPALIFQTVFTIGSSMLQFTPQIAMFALLELLQQKADVPGFTKAAWALVLALGLAILVSAWSEAWTHWMFISRLGVPIRSELSAIVFSKATRRKDVKSVQMTKEGHFEGTLPIPTDGVQTPSPIEVGATDTMEEGVQKSRQGTINLVGVDAKRVSDFSMYLFIFPWAITKMAVSIVILTQLLGWKSLLSGFAIFIIVLPINVIVSKKFSDAQGSLMEVRDKKLVIITEALQGIRQIKFSAQEQQWQSKIDLVRQEELATQWKVFYLDTCLITVWILGPVMLSAVSLAVYASLYGTLSASVAFTSISVFASLEMTLAVIPELISDGLEAFISVKRIDEYLRAPEKENTTIVNEAIVFQNASIAWPSDNETADETRFVLRDIDVKIPLKELSVISGPTGSGKSLLLAALIGEADQVSGIITCPQPPLSTDRYDYTANKSDWILDSAIAFVAQIPWIENATIKENILFDLPFDKGRYKKVLECCALEKDMGILPDGDQTDIGANGINLSGGQRWRVSFARALYSRAGILILDDIFSAVDAHVGRQLFEEALTGDLGRGRTRILVTHHIGLCLPKAKYSVILGNGTVEYAGLPDNEVLGHDMEAREEQSQNEQEEPVNHETASQEREMLRKVLSHNSQRSRKIDDGELDTQGKLQPKKFTEVEKRETGSVKFDIYREYLNYSGGIWFWVPIVGLYTFYECLILGRSFLISLWTRSYESHSSLVTHHAINPLMVLFTKTTMSDKSGPETNLTYYLSVYMGLSIAICVMGSLRFLFIYRASLQASKKLFQNITYAVLRAPLRWLDTIPVGRILNRMTADFALIDSRLGVDLGFLLYQVIQLAGIIIAGLFVSPWMLLSALVLLLVCARFTLLFLAGAREVKRLESNAKSPIFEQFGSALAGIGTIRAFGKSETYIERMFDKIDAHARATWHLFLFNRWLTLRLNVVGAVFAILITAFIVYSRIEASLAGFALSFALQYSTALIWSAKQYAEVELSMNAVERVTEYAKIPIEDQGEKIPVPAAWPNEGKLEVSDLVVGYAVDLPPVLKGLSFNVDGNQRVGVVGRTGAGKSSLTLALFRFLEPRSGSIHIDGIDISTIALSTLRSRLAIIPQDPVLFSGTVRSNLDPFDDHTDPELYDALERVHLIHSGNSTGSASRDEPANTTPNFALPSDNSSAPTLTNPTAIHTNKSIFTSLTSPISEGGLNLSQGQRQLLCLARAIVARPKLMILDEATSAVDMATDALIQRSIREEFQDSTLIVIAHRLSTIADFERVLVVDEGKGIEYASPAELLEKDNGVFRSMVEKSGEMENLKAIIRDAERS